jgi:Fe-S cluster assembly protein SufD
VNDLHLAPGAKLNYIAIQEWSDETLAFHINSTLVHKHSECTALAANFGGKFIRGESLSRMVGEGSRSEMLSLNPLDGKRQIDQRTLQDHAAPSASSDLLYLNALDDETRSIFAGLIKVEVGAHGTDAYQKVRNLMLSDTAEANSMPGLEILADGVRCTHGATSGEINEEELFYLEARGISKTYGRRLIVNGFFQTLLQRFKDEALREHLSKMVAAKLGLPF